MWTPKALKFHFLPFCNPSLFYALFLVLMYIQKYSAASLCSITTEVLKVLNATEELLGEAEGKVHDPSPAGTPLSSSPGNKKLDEHLTKMEENVRLMNYKQDPKRSISIAFAHVVLHFNTKVAFKRNQRSLCSFCGEIHFWIVQKMDICFLVMFHL